MLRCPQELLAQASAPTPSIPMGLLVNKSLRGTFAIRNSFRLLKQD